MSKKYLEIVSFFLLFIVLVFLLIYGLGNWPIEQWDEQTNFSVVTESAASEDPLILKGVYQDYFFEKPPLWYWLGGMIINFGGNFLSLRVISVVCSLILFGGVVFLLRRKYKYGLVSGAALFVTISQLYVPNISGYFSSHTFRSIDADVLQILFIFLSYLVAVLGNINENRRIIMINTFCALAFMSKGPLALITLISINTFLILESKFSKQLLIKLILGTLVFLGLVIPWHVYMFSKFGTVFSAAYFNYHILERIILPIEAHNEKWYFYLQLFTNFKVNPTWPLTILGLYYLCKTRFKDRVAALAGFIFIIFFCMLQIVQTKLAWYILPVYPFSVILGAYGVEKLLKSTRSDHRLKLIKLSLVLFIAFAIGRNIFLVLSH